MNDVHTLYYLIFDYRCSGCDMWLFVVFVVHVENSIHPIVGFEHGYGSLGERIVANMACRMLETKCTKSRFAVKPHTNILWSFDRCLLGDLQMVMSHDP